jgi:predicted FMN-binding regulatory protein PaiB
MPEALKGIVALVLHFMKWIGVRKLSQNDTPANRDEVIAGTTRDNHALGQVLARKTAG